jgi:hypothetical protein
MSGLNKILEMRKFYFVCPESKEIIEIKADEPVGPKLSNYGEMERMVFVGELSKIEIKILKRELERDEFEQDEWEERVDYF